MHGRLQPYTFLLAGVVCNAFTGALIMALNALADFFQAHGILFWLMGSLQVQSYWLVFASAVYLVIGVVWLLRHTREFNVLSLGEESAAQLGVAVGRTRRVAFAVSSLLVGAAVSVSGMIGFVGLIVPHVTRLLIGADYRLLLPASVLVGGVPGAAGTVAQRWRDRIRSAWSRRFGGPLHLSAAPRRRPDARLTFARMTDAAIELHDVSFGYASAPVLHALSFAIGRGEFVGIIGPNGSGKSTLLRVMSGILKPQRGQVSIAGHPAERYGRRELGRLIGVVPQETAVTSPLSVRWCWSGARRTWADSGSIAPTTCRGAARDGAHRNGAPGAAADHRAERRRATRHPGGAGAGRDPMPTSRPPFSIFVTRSRCTTCCATCSAAGSVVSVLHDLNLAAVPRAAPAYEGRLARRHPDEVITYANYRVRRRVHVVERHHRLPPSSVEPRDRDRRNNDDA